MENQTHPSAQNEPAVVKHHDPKAALIAARGLIESQSQWRQGQRKNGPMSFCAEEACMRSELWDRRDASNALIDAIGRSHSGIGMQIITWNDAPGRTHTEVLAAFDRAIALCGTVTVTTPAEQRTVA